MGHLVKWSSTLHMTQTCRSEPKEEKEKKNLIFLLFMAVSSFPLLSSLELQDAGNKHCPSLSENTFALLSLKILYLQIAVHVR